MTVTQAIALNIGAAAALMALLFVAMRIPHLVTGKPSEASLRRAARRAARHAAVTPSTGSRSEARRRRRRF